MIGRLLLEWRTQQALEYENKTKQYTKEEIFQDDQMVYLLAPQLIGITDQYYEIQARFHWSIIHRHSFRQDTLCAERCHWAFIGWHVSHEPNQERLSAYPTRYS